VKGNTARPLDSGAVNPYAAPADPSPASGQAPLQGADLAALSQRLSAHLLDMVLYLAAAIPGGALGGILGSSFASARTADPNDGIAAFAAAFAGLSFLAFFAYQSSLVARSGQSLGKRWTHIRIVLENGEAPGFWKGVVLRSLLFGLLRVIPLVGPVSGMVDTLRIFGADRRCLHDRVAGTRVVQG
jgi:uncharacterized RDD family membrane protein YckC